MQEHFPEGYEIDREEEVVIGQTTHYDERNDSEGVEVAGVRLNTRERTSGAATTVDKTEYRIHYRRK